VISAGLLFCGGGEPDYGRRLSRLRWRRRFPEACPVAAECGDRAADVLAGALRWVAVRDESAVPFGDAAVVPRPGQVVLPAFLGAFASGQPHTLRELERADFRPDCAGSAEAGARAPALVFQREDFAAGPGEALDGFLRRLASPPTPQAVEPAFGVFVFRDPSESPRPEVARLVPESCRRLLDVGCGAGATGAELARLRPELVVEGVEQRPAAAALARKRLSRVHEGDAYEVLRRLRDEGSTYDGFLFADVLEHLPDPVGALTLALGLAEPGATLVASVPNAGHLSLVRDLIGGRFDPLPAGLADSGHLRWFTRLSLGDTLEEAGWSVGAIEAEPGSEPPHAADFLGRLAGWPFEREGLLAYQWLAVARAGWTGRRSES
jgi:SAM-dependent methyltransferase